MQYLACATVSHNQGCNGYQECGCPSIVKFHVQIVLNLAQYLLNMYSLLNVAKAEQSKTILAI